MAEVSRIETVEVPSMDEFNTLKSRVNALEAIVAAWSSPVAQPVEPPIVAPPEPTPPGVIISRPFATQAEVVQFMWSPGRWIKKGDKGAAVYDPVIGGAKLPIIPGQGFVSLRDDSAWAREQPEPIGRVYVQYDFYVPQSFYDQPWDSMHWDSIKTLRLYNQTKRDGWGDGAATLTMLPPSGEMWVRAAGRYSDGDALRMEWLPPADEWVTIRITYDYDAPALEFRAENHNGSTLHEAACDMDALPPLDNAAFLMHSTSRGHHGSVEGETETFFGYRNLIMGVE